MCIGFGMYWVNGALRSALLPTSLFLCSNKARLLRKKSGVVQAEIVIVWLLVYSFAKFSEMVYHVSVVEARVDIETIPYIAQNHEATESKISEFGNIV